MRRLLADENVPSIVIRRLRDAGHDVVRVEPGMDDERILAWAARDDRVVLTLDSDFGRLALLGASGARGGVLPFRESPTPPALFAALVVDLLRNDALELSGRVTIWKRGQLRQRGMSLS